MTVMSPTRALPGQTFWPAAPAASTVPAVRADTPTPRVPAVPTQAGAGSVRPTPGGPTGLRGRGAGPVPSLRELGVDPSTLGTGRPSTFAGASASAEPGGERVLRCAGSALCAAQHLLEQAAPDPLTLAQVVEADPVLTL
ncbi:MAG TPA: hypothetical protein PKB06_00115, partial [Actinotalea sp.]|nr:hypothetical protein [Actinotalea sp.]